MELSYAPSVAKFIEDMDFKSEMSWMFLMKKRPNFYNIKVTKESTRVYYKMCLCGSHALNSTIFRKLYAEQLDIDGLSTNT